MGVKYTIPFRANDDVKWRVDILLSTYKDTPITLRSQGETGAVLEWSPSETDNPYSAYISSKLSLNIYNQGELDVREFQRASDRQYKVELYRNNALYWTGYLDSKDTQRPLKQLPYNFTISAKDGLTFLNDIPYVHDDLTGTGDVTSRNPMNYIRQILFTNLGLPLPIKWTNKLENISFLGQDVFTGGVQWSTKGEGFKDRSSGYVLESLLRAFQCQIKQVNGSWVIRRINDSVTGVMPFKQIGDGLGRLVINSGSENIRKQIGRDGYRFVNEDSIMINKPGVKTVKATYAGDVKENILPNGNFDFVEQFYNTTTASYEYKPIYWDNPFPGGNSPISVQSVPSLDGRSGYAVKVTPLRAVGSYALIKPLPIDTKVLIKKIDFSFLFSAEQWLTVFPPLTPGGPEVNDGETMNMDQQPLRLRITYRIGNNTYYLNQFGYWTSVSTIIDIKVEGLKLGEIAQIKFDRFQGIVMPEPPNELLPGDTCDIKLEFIIPGQSLNIAIFDNVSIVIEENNDIYENTDEKTDNTLVEEVELNISSSFGGNIVSNLMSSYDKSPTEMHYKDGDYYTGTLTGLTANSIMRFRNKPSEIFTGSIYVSGKNWSIDEIYLIDSMGTTTFMPIGASYTIESCRVSLTAIECRNDNAIFTEKFYGSNNNILSN